MKYFIISLVLIVIAQTLAYFQLQSQFIWNWAKQHPIIISFLGVPVSILLIYFTKYCAEAFSGQIWPGRLIGFAIGAIVFAILSHYVMHEPFTTKTIVSLILAFGILLIQIFWK
jgi:hypothetical protein